MSEVKAGADEAPESGGSSDQRRFHLAAGVLQHQRPSYRRPHPCYYHALTHHTSAPAISLRASRHLESRRSFTPVDFFAFAAARLCARRPKGQSLDTRSLARGIRFRPPSTTLDFHRNRHRSWRTSANLSVDSALNVAAADPILTQFLLAIAINTRHHEHPLFSLFQRSAEDHSGDPVWSLLA